MGTSKRRNAKAPPQIHGRTTRSRGKALGDPAENTQLLERQLRSLGLYAASTLGDGNCLFRALSDQLYGSDTFHSKLRADVCNWIETHKDRYEPFVDDERGLAVHLQCMRQQGTYGGHLELSAFAHMAKRNVKVVQPGLVYVIEWGAGGDTEPQDSPSPSSAPDTTQDEDEEKPMTRRERKRIERERSSVPPPTSHSNGDNPLGPVYVAYHIYEHYSSIRNLRGPHSGTPNVQESPATDDDDTAAVAVPSVNRKKLVAVRSGSVAKTKSKTEARRAHATGSRLKETVTLPLTPSQIPLPMSRSPSPVPDELPAATQSPFPYPLPSTPPSPSRIYRSPKRTFDESSASSEGSHTMPKRAKSSKPGPTTSRLNPDFDLDTPSLTASRPGSPTSMSELSSLSSSPESTPPPTAERLGPPLTQRQRKKLGLPRQRTAVVASAKATSAGKIKIPGGRCSRAGTAKLASEASEEWQTNGSGRLDVRGFKELKI